MVLFFEEVGLSRYEGMAYDALVRFGKATAARISTESGVPYGRIYDILGALVQQGLAKVLPGKTKEYIPSDPVALLALVEKKKEMVLQAEKDIKELKKYYELSAREPVLLAYGKRNFTILLNEAENATRYEYNIKYTSTPRPEWLHSVQKGVKKGIDMKTLARYDNETKKNVQAWVAAKTGEVKPFTNDGVAIVIRDDREVLISLIKSNTTMLIRDGPFAKVMRQLFNATWATERPIQKE